MIQSDLSIVQSATLFVPLFLGGVVAFLLTFVFTIIVRKHCFKVGWLDLPSARRIHTRPIPRLGGVAIFASFVCASLIFYSPGSANEKVIYWLLLAASTLIVLVHFYDDVVGLPWLPKLIAQTAAVLIILGPWDGLFHGILLFTFNNPFGRTIVHAGLPWYLQPTFILFIHPLAASQLPAITFAAIPAVLLTWFWTAGMMNTVNWIDGMDGLATGVVGIAGLFITLISFILHQQSIAILAAIFTGAVLGFLPLNWNPAKIIMGDTGSMFLGLGLAVLSIMGGAKLALALMVLGVPILDVAIVIMNRIRRGQSPTHYDKTHLHHRLMATGLSVRQICYMIYGLSLLFGLLALSVSGSNYSHLYKLVGLGLVGIAMVGLIIWIDYRQRQRGVPIVLDEPGPTPPETPEVRPQRESGENLPQDMETAASLNEQEPKSSAQEECVVPPADSHFAHTEKTGSAS